MNEGAPLNKTSWSTWF